MSDCSPLKLAENDNSPSQSSGSQTSQTAQQIDIRHIQHDRLRSDRQNFSRPGGEENNRIRARCDSESSSKSGQLRYGARNVIELFIPVSLCMSIVVATMRATDSYRYSGQTMIWYAQVMFTDQSVDTSTRVWQSFANAFIMLILIVIMTTILILLYKFRCYKIIHGWLILSSLILLFMFAIMYVGEILKVYNVPMDNYTLMILIWNFGVVGMICIHWKGPLLLQQAYLITISALLALVFIRSLPDWTTWTVLGIVSIWDLVAVLCPRGPLRILVETAQERNEAIFPALIYSSTMLWEVATTVVVMTTPSISMAEIDGDRPDKSNRNRKHNRDRRNRRKIPDEALQQSSSQEFSTSRLRGEGNLSNRAIASTRQVRQHPIDILYEEGVQQPEVQIVQPSTSSALTEPHLRPGSLRATGGVDNHLVSGEAHHETINHHNMQQQTAEERGVKLGLGDFIFFSLLVGKASSYNDWVVTMSCYVAILVGLCLTLTLLAVFRKALPALPISIAFGLCSFFMSYIFAAPFAEKLSTNQVFI